MSDVITEEILRSLGDGSKHASVSALTLAQGISQFVDNVASFRFGFAPDYSFQMYYRDTIRYFDEEGVGDTHSKGEETHVLEFTDTFLRLLSLRIVVTVFPDRNALVDADPPVLSVELYNPNAVMLFEEVIKAAQPILRESWGRVEVRD